jgi:hypothetical protein
MKTHFSLAAAILLATAGSLCGDDRAALVEHSTPTAFYECSNRIPDSANCRRRAVRSPSSIKTGIPKRFVWLSPEIRSISAAARSLAKCRLLASPWRSKNRAAFCINSCGRRSAADTFGMGRRSNYGPAFRRFESLGRLLR